MHVEFSSPPGEIYRSACLCFAGKLTTVYFLIVFIICDFLCRKIYSTHSISPSLGRNCRRGGGGGGGGGGGIAAAKQIHSTRYLSEHLHLVVDRSNSSTTSTRATAIIIHEDADSTPSQATCTACSLYCTCADHKAHAQE